MEAVNDLASRVLPLFLSQLVRITLKSLFTRSTRDASTQTIAVLPHLCSTFFFAISMFVLRFLLFLLEFLPLVKPSCVSLVLTEWKETANVIYIRVMDAKFTI